MDIKQLEEQLQLTFRQPHLIKQAFTHSSYVNEHRDSEVNDNERLEFLGDAVLELGVSQFLFREHEALPEGELTKRRAAIVCEPSLTKFALELGFDKFLLLGKGEEQSGGRKRPAILADAFEAFLGALYLDQGFEQVLRFLERYVFPKIDEQAFSNTRDYKTELQEKIQQDRNKKIEYDIIDEKGPSHNKEFIANVLVNGEVFGQGIGRTKKEAEQRAAKEALDKLEGKN